MAARRSRHPHLPHRSPAVRFRAGLEQWKSHARGLLAVEVASAFSATSSGSGPRSSVPKVTWGGDPSKPVLAEGGSASIGPRKSFEAWKQLVDGQSLPWTPAGCVLRRSRSATSW